MSFEQRHRVQKHRDVTISRLESFRGKNHLRSKLYSAHTPVELHRWDAPDRVPFSRAISETFEPAAVGDSLGPIWATHWLRVTITVPANDARWLGKPVALLFDFGGEAMVWSESGVALQGMNGQSGDDRRDEFVAIESARAGQQVTLYLELACNELFGNSKWNVGPCEPDVTRGYSIKQCEIAILDRDVWALLWDFVVISDIARGQDKEGSHAAQALWAANQMVNACNLDDPTTIAAARRIAAEYFARPFPSALRLSAIGHCHIDTAWLWPYAETRRKCARSWATQLRLMDEYPEYKFTCSQAQQFAWLKEDHPELFARIKERAKEGRFIPIGGTWVEMDCNIPAGESLVRQFLVGQRFFREEFGSYCSTFWLPDTFGYAAQIPQLVSQAGIKYFLTQKLSWNQFNKFPHNTFLWEGIDGSRVLTHFPPADNYCSHANVADIRKSETNFKDKERSAHSLLVYGHGDGGGGPSPAMLEMLTRLQHGVGGLPTIEFRDPNAFFDDCSADSDKLCVWSGELYFEYHRGTYTTQARNKLGNRRAEGLLHDVEFVYSALAAGERHGAAVYPRAQLEQMWRLTLLNQFHDVIPGTSIPEVFADSAVHYAQIQSTGNMLLQSGLRSLLPQRDGAPAAGERTFVAVNTLAVLRREVVELESASGKQLVIAETPACGWAAVSPSAPPADGETVELVDTELGDGRRSLVLRNAHVSASFDERAHLVSLVHLPTGKQAIALDAQRGGGNRFALFLDSPLYWDAWDVDVYHLETRYQVGAPSSITVLERGPLRASFEVKFSIGNKSSLTQVVSLTAVSGMIEFDTQVDWHEEHKFLKVEFPWNVRSAVATYEIPFGFIQRPTHFNTSWDMARFEVCAQRWADLSEYGFGVALLNDCKYGYSTHGNVMALSLLRSAKAPDPTADMGTQRFRYAVLPHGGGGFQDGNVVQHALQFNTPLRVVELAGATEVGTRSLFWSSHASVVIDTIKLAEEQPNASEVALVLRAYEAYGGSCDVSIATSVPNLVRAVECNLLEEQEQPPLERTDEGHSSVAARFTPFQLKSFKLVFAL